MMRKQLVSVLTGFMACTFTICADESFAPDPDKSYFIQHSSGLFLTVSNNTAKLENMGTASQEFTFTPVTGEVEAWNISYDGTHYLSSDDGWTVKFGTDPSDSYTQFMIEPHSEPGYYKLYDIGRQGCYGSDSTTPGSGVYTNKSGNAVNDAWKIFESGEGLITAMLESMIGDARSLYDTITADALVSETAAAFVASEIAIAESVLAEAVAQAELTEAENRLDAVVKSVRLLEEQLGIATRLLADAEIGNTSGMWPQVAADEFARDIDNAREAWELADANQYNTAAGTLGQKTEVFRTARFAFVPQQGHLYALANMVSHYVLEVNGSGAAAIDEVTGSESQLFNLALVEGVNTALTLQVADGRGYLAYKDGWDSRLVSSADEEAAFIYLQPRSVKHHIYSLNRPGFNGAWACDNHTPGSLVYTNKGKDWDTAQWVIIDMSEDNAVSSLFESLKAQGAELVAGATPGTAPGCWAAEDIEQLEEALALALNAECANNQEILDAALWLLGSIVDFEARQVVFKPGMVDLGAFDALMEQARELLAAAKVGIMPGQYLLSEIENFSQLTDNWTAIGKCFESQDACDEACAAVESQIAAFAGHSDWQEAAFVLTDAVQCCEILLTYGRENEGTEQGQWRKEVIDAFELAITKARNNSSPKAADIDELMDARAQFLNGTVSQDRSALRTAIETATDEEFAQLPVGEYDGYYSQEAVDAFVQALADAERVLADLDADQESIDSATARLDEAVRTLRASRVKIDFNMLDNSIKRARNAVGGVTLIGYDKGACPIEAVDNLKSAISRAEMVNRQEITQTQTDTEANQLDAAIDAFRMIMVDATGLASAIGEAQTLLSEATVGFCPGNYPLPYVLSLQDAVEQAQNTLDDPDSMQSQLLDSLLALQACMASMIDAIVPAHDLTALMQLIQQAEAWLEVHGHSYLLETALAEAKEAVADKDNLTADQMTEAENNLRAALAFCMSAGVEMPEQSVCVCVHGDQVIAVGIPDGAVVSICSLQGETICRQPVVGGSFRMVLNPGMYIVIVENNCLQQRFKVMTL